MQYEALTAPLPARPPAVLPSAPRSDERPRAVWISGASSPLCKFAHKSSTQATGTYALHDHPFYEIVYIVSGEVEFMVGTEPFRLGNHSLVAFPPTSATACSWTRTVPTSATRSTSTRSV